MRPAGAVHRRLHLGIFLDRAAALGRDLQIGDLAVPFRMGRQEALIGFQPQRDALGIIQPVHPDHQGARHRGDNLLDKGSSHRAPRQPGEIAGLDPHREGADAHGPVAGAQPERHVRGRAQLLGQVAGEIGGVAVGLESHQVVIAQRRDQGLVIGHGGEDFRRRQRDMQEKADAVVQPARAQRLGQRDQVIVMHPDDVVGPAAPWPARRRNAR